MKLRTALMALLVVGALGGGWYYWTRQPDTQTETSRPGGRRAGADGPVTVLVAPVETKTVPVYREGIGNIQASALVTVRAQVDGLLTAVEFNEGQMVTRGMVLARIDPAIWKAQYDQAVAKKAQDEANLANARVDMTRYQQLAAANAGSKQQADQQKALVAQLEAQVRADEAAINNARAYLAYTVITSPIDGRAGLRQVDPGNIIRASDAAGLVTVAQLQPIAALFTLPQRDLAAVSTALAAGEVGVEALDTDGQTVLGRGRLDVIDNQVDVTTGTIKLKAIFANEERKLWPGQFINVRVKVAELAGALVVPTQAIRRGPQGTFVYVVSDDKARMQPVTVTLQDEHIAVIGNGVAVADRIVTAGFARLSDGKAVQAQSDPAATPGSSAAQPAAAPARQPRGEGKGNGEGRERRRANGGEPAARPAGQNP